MRARIRVSLAVPGFLSLFLFSPLSLVVHAQAEAPAQQSSPASATPAAPATPAAAANNAASVVPPEAPDHRISLDVVVTDKAGNPQSGLQQRDFTILDDKQPENILSFRATDEGSAAEPMQIIFLLDAVNTGAQTMGFERLELEKFLRQDGGHLALPTSLVFLTDTSTEVQPGTTRDGNALADLLKSKETGLRIIGRSQGIYGAMDRFNLGLTALERISGYEARQPGRKLLVWFSSGWPMLSGPRLELTKKNEDWLFNGVVTMSRALREARVTLYSVDPLGTSDAGSFRTFYYESFLKGVPSSSKVLPGNLALQVLAAQTGGKVLNSNNDLTKLIANCVIDAKAYYTMSFIYPPADHPDEFHSLEIKVDKPGLTARTRMGYYAQPYKDTGR
jgi:VWFA-related protein